MKKAIDKTFEAMLKAELSAAAYEGSPATLGITKTRFTQLLRNPSTADRNEVEGLARVLQRPPVGLVVGYQLGWNKLTLSDAEQMGKIVFES